MTANEWFWSICRLQIKSISIISVQCAHCSTVMPRREHAWQSLCGCSGLVLSNLLRICWVCVAASFVGRWECSGESWTPSATAAATHSGIPDDDCVYLLSFRDNRYPFLMPNRACSCSNTIRSEPVPFAWASWKKRGAVQFSRYLFF